MHTDKPVKPFTVISSQLTVEKTCSFLMKSEKTHGAKSMAAIFYSMPHAQQRDTKFIRTVNRKPITVNGHNRY